MAPNAYERRFFVLAPSFHGATLLARLLHSHPGITALGDTYPENRLDQVCGCGSPVSDCPFWTRVKEVVRADQYLAQPRMLPCRPKILGRASDRLLYGVLPDKALTGLIGKEQKDRFRTDYESFLGAVHGLQPGSPEVFADGVKRIDRVRIMLALGCRIAGIIHLTREPGDFVKSFQKNTGKGFTALIRSALWWRLYHRRASRLARQVPYLRLGYEELTENPDPALARLFRFLGLPTLKLDDLMDINNDPWHFMGHSSLLKFNGMIKRRRYNLHGWEKILVTIMAGGTQSVHEPLTTNQGGRQ